MPNNELQKILGARFKEHTHPTDEAVWSAIEAQLDEKQKDRSGIWFWFLNGLAMVVLCSAMPWSKTTVDSGGSEIAQLNEDFSTESQIKETNNSTDKGLIDRSETTLKASSDRSEPAKTEYETPKSTHSNSIKRESVFIGEAIDPIAMTKSIPPYPEFVIVENERSNQTTKDELLVDPLPPIDWKNQSLGADVKFNCLQPIPYPKNYLRNLPIHLGIEFSYLNRRGTSIVMLSEPDSTYMETNNQLAFNRHFELSTFAQFDFTRRFSASVGIGYSNSVIRYGNDSTINASYSSYPTTPVSSEMHVITLPVQARFTFVQKNRFAWHGGLTVQTEFGRITHNELENDNFTVSPSPIQTESLPSESLIVTKFDLRQVAFEPFTQFSFSLSPRISAFTNLGYKMYWNQSKSVFNSQDRLNYYHADFGLLFRLK